MKPYMISVNIDGHVQVWGAMGESPMDALNNVKYLERLTFTIIEIVEIKDDCAMSVRLR